MAGLHHKDRNGEGRRIRAFDLMHVKHPLWLAELCPRKWRNAVDLRHTPLSKSALVSTEARLACPVGIPEMVLAAGLAPALATFSTSCLCIGLREQIKWSLQPVMLRQDFITKEIRRLLHGGEMVAVPSAALGLVGL